jgi:hypothetical protein
MVGVSIPIPTAAIGIRTVITAIILAIAIIGMAAGTTTDALNSCCFQRSQIMSLKAPASVKAEHDELHRELVLATEAGGRTGKAAEVVARLMHSHFLKEEEFALPPLGLIAELANGRLPAHATAVLPLTDRLEAELPTMLAEHKQIVGALNELITAATAEKRPEHVRFAEKLLVHARTEEEVMYPAAILVGKWVRERAGAAV